MRPDTRLPDFATAPADPFGIRLLSPGDGSGGLLVADTTNILRYDAGGHVVQTYNNPSSPEHGWFTVALGVDATSFWATSGRLYHFDLATGRILLGPITINPTAEAVCVKKGPWAASAANLSLTKTGAPDPSLVGGTLTYTLTAANPGPATATNVVVTDPLPAGVTFVSATTSQGSCSQTSGTVSCSLGTLPVGGSAAITIQASPNTKGALTNTAQVSADQGDMLPANGVATATTRALALNGSAFGLQVRSLLINVGPTPFVSQSGPGRQSASLPSISVAGVASADGLTASTQVGPDVTPTSVADVADVKLVAGTVVASGVHVTCTSDASGASGSTTIASLTVAGQTLTNITPAPNTGITIPLVGTLVLNEQTQPAPGSITVNGLHLKLIGGTDVVIARATCVTDP